MKIWNEKSLLNRVRSTILSEGSTRIHHIVLQDLTTDLVCNPSLTHLRHLRILLSNLITGLIGTGSLPPHHLDLCHLRKRSVRNLLKMEAASGVRKQDICERIAQIGNERSRVQQALSTRNPDPRLQLQLSLLFRKLPYYLRKI